MTTLSVMGLYRYDETLFDVMVIPEDLDAATLKANILAECADLEVIIPDPDVFKEVLLYWSTAHLSNWEKMLDVLTAEYNPLWNKDGEFKETRDLELGNTVTGKVSAFNVSTFQNASQTTASGTDEGTITRTEKGNIGVTTSQHMLTEEIEVRQKYNIYDLITEDFKSRFCLLVY